MKNFINKLKRVKKSEMLDIWKLPVSAIVAPFYRMKHRDLWIICEDKAEARDNGYWMFKYICENVPQQECVYAIAHNSADIDKVRAIGRIVEFGSLKHWILYFASTKKLSSQKAGNPNAAIFYFLEVYGVIKNNRIFLQHGITINNAKWLYYNVTKMKRFICGARPEYDYVNELFGYPAENVVYTGFPRFDGLHDQKPERIVLIMPTWREWIADEDHRLLEYEGTTEIEKTNYFIKWNDFLNSERIKDISERYGVQFVFFPHRNMQKYMEHFSKSKPYLRILSGSDCGVQEIMKKASLMVTDYSSVFMDFAYMMKPIVFYQFDYDMFRRGQYQEGYFDYNKNDFGYSFSEPEKVFDDIERIINNGFAVSEEFKKAHQRFFPIYDSNNCLRVFEAVKKV